MCRREVRVKKEEKTLTPRPAIAGSGCPPADHTVKKVNFLVLQLKKLNNGGIMKLRTNTIRSARVEYPPGLC
jgi:hypothetical protein